MQQFTRLRTFLRNKLLFLQQRTGGFHSLCQRSTGLHMLCRRPGGLHLLRYHLKMLRFRSPLFRSSEDIFYIGGTDVLPPPLSSDEEHQCLVVLSGVKPEEENLREQARKQLIAHNLRLVVYLAKKFENTGINVEDLISIGTIGLIKGINTFNPNRNIKLATYASRCIENEILMYLRHNSRTRVEVSIDEPLNVDWDGNELLLSDILGTDEDLISRDMENEAEIQVLRKALRTLDNRESEIIRMRYGLNRPNGKEMTQKEVADCLGISQSYISRLEKKIMMRLKREILKFE